MTDIKSLMDNFSKWQGLEKKLAAGLTPSEACNELGIPESIAEEYLSAKEALHNFEMGADDLFSRDVMKKAIKELLTLIEFAEDEDVRRKASSDLLGWYRDERKRLEAKFKKAFEAATVPQDDIFDNRWVFKKSD